MNKFLFTAIPFVLALSTNAQPEKVLTTKDYEQAQSRLAAHTEPFVDGSNVRPNWLGVDSFWYKVQTAKGSEFIIVNATKGTRALAFDHQKMAVGLSKASGKTYQSNALPIQNFIYTPSKRTIKVLAEGKTWSCDLLTYECAQEATNIPVPQGGIGRRQFRNNDVVSPDGLKTAFIKDYNLWVREVTSGKLTQLTTDGIKDFGYATDNAGWKHSDKAILLWSSDSKKIATFKQDQRNVSDMYLVSTNVGKPTLISWKYPLPGDKEIATIQRVVINVDVPKVVVLQVPPDPHRATLSDDISSSGTFDDVNWSTDGSTLAFVSTSRDHKQEKFRIADATTGAVQEVFEEDVPTQYESGWDGINWRYLSKSHEIIWFSERDNWGHLYLYDAFTGKVKNQITKGEWLVKQVVKVDEQNRMIYFIADGLELINPYFSQLCKVGFDGKHFAVLTPEDGNHTVTFSPTYNYFVDSYSKPDVPATTVLRNTDGKIMTTLEKADVSRLIATGWKPPVSIVVKAHDGKTDLYGLMFTPTKLDSSKKYPIIDYIYPGPQGGSVGNWSFAASRGDNQALAELGFIVVVIEGSSNPLRSKSFHDMSYGNMAENTLPDQITGIQQLAAKHNYIDTSRVGIWGHSGGGFATAAAMFRYPDFFKVGISESGNHDNRNYEDDWGERYNGLTSASDYNAQANQIYAKNLKGKLMLAHGLMDDNVPPQNTLLVIEALEKANKDYDLVVFPNSPHGYGEYSPYMMRRRWDYFVKYLLRAEPPKEYQIK